MIARRHGAIAYLISGLYAALVTSGVFGRRLVPDEQRLYRDIMRGYEASVRPVVNHSKPIIIRFRLTLNQITDLDERSQVLTTNVFIDQEWVDEKLRWDTADYNGIRTLRIPASYVWLPDTFIFNNADDGSTGFMQGVYVLLNNNGTVLWPVPVKLKSSCKVNIAYFPFDDQICILRFGSWIYSGEWMDFESSMDDLDLGNYIDNSEWELLTVNFEKGIRSYACCPDPHPDITYTLHMRRRTFYYLFNIIVPCIMLSILTLLTFWLPTTSGEKISLGLSVFLAFSMFMLLIAEEVPATSESVPLIGIYLTTVMTMTSVSVVMAVMVINLFNRGSKARRAPNWLKKVVLDWISCMMHMTHDVERLARTLKLDDEEEEKYRCPHHCYDHEVNEDEEMRPAYNPYHEIVHSTAEALARSHYTPDDDSHRGELSKRFGRIQTYRRGLRERRRSERQTHVYDTFQQPIFTSSECVPMKPLGKYANKPDILHKSNSATLPVRGRVCSPAGESLPNSLGRLSPSPDRWQTTHFSGPLPPSSTNRFVVESCDSDSDVEPGDSPVWLPRRSFKGKQKQQPLLASSNHHPRNEGVYENDFLASDEEPTQGFTHKRCSSKYDRMEAMHRHLAYQVSNDVMQQKKQETLAKMVVQNCRMDQALRSRKTMIVEWQTIATVIDRLLFWIFFTATMVCYIVILIVIPNTSASLPLDADSLRVPKRPLEHS